MRAIATDLVHVLLSLHFYSVCLLAGLSIAGCRCGRGGALHRLRYWLAIAAALYYLASAQVFGNFLLARFEDMHGVPTLNEEKSSGATILVLSAGWPRMTAAGYRAFLGEDGIQRVMTGVALWRRFGGKLLFSGAPAPDASDSVAHEMAHLAAGLGVPEDAILIESRSRNTYENLVYSRDLLRADGDAGGRVVMVVSAFQMPRAVAVARKLEMAVVPYPCNFQANPHPGWQYWIPSNDGAQVFEAVLHELIGLAQYWWHGRI